MLIINDTDAINTATRLNSLTFIKTSLNVTSSMDPIDWPRQRRKMKQTIKGQKSKKVACRNSTE